MGEKKEYRSAIRSRRLIRQAFLELLREKAIEKITVTDIVNRADINRSTFYAHYPDVMGLVEEMMEESVQRSIDMVADLDIRDIFENPKPFLQGLTHLGLENMEIYKLLRNSDFALRQSEKLKSVLLERAIHTMNIPQSVRESSTFHIHMHFFIGGIFNTYQHWIEGKLHCSAEDIMDQVAHLITNTKDIYLNMNL